MRPYGNPHLDPVVNADLARVKERMAAARRMTKEQQDALWKELEEKSARTRRAKLAYRGGRVAERRRRCRFGPHPKASRQFVTMATTALRDAHLPKTATALLGIVCALAGSTGYTDATNQALGALVNRSRSTVKRAIGILVDRGYLQRTLIHNARGSVVAHRLVPTDLAWPYWHPKRQNPQEHCGSTNAPHITFPLKGESNEPEEDRSVGAERSRCRRGRPGEVGI